jgi:hypothetical protein
LFFAVTVTFTIAGVTRAATASTALSRATNELTLLSSSADAGGAAVAARAIVGFSTS